MAHWLDALFDSGGTTIEWNGTVLPDQGTLAFGEQFEVANDPSNDRNVVTIRFVGMDGDVTGDTDENLVTTISGDEEESTVRMLASALLWDEDASEGEAELSISGGESDEGAIQLVLNGKRAFLAHDGVPTMGNSTAINFLQGGARFTTRTVSSNVTLDTTTTDMLVFVDASVEREITLATPTNRNGRVFIFVISGASTVTIKRSASEQINGVAGSYIVPFEDACVVVTTNGTNYFARSFSDDAGGGGGGGGEQPMMEFSSVDTLLFDNNSPQAPSGAAQTDGCMFFIRPGSDLDITGIRFYWHGAAATTVKCVLWSPAGANIASVNVNTSGAGIYTGTFSSPITCDPGGAGAGAFNRRYVCSVRDIGGGTPVYTKYDKTSPPSNCWPAFPFFGGRRIGWINFSLWIAGDAVPTTTANTEVYPVEPVLVEL